MKQRDQIKVAFDAQKQKLDTTTRRKTRAFWIGVSVVCLALGCCVGYALARLCP